MTVYNHKNKSGGGNDRNNQPHQQKKKTFSEYGEEVKAKFFEDHFNELLNMSNSTQLQSVIERIEKFVEKEGVSITTNQIRNIYDKAIKAKTVNELQLIRPNIAYIAGKNENNRAKGLLAFIELVIKEVDSPEKMVEFKTFFESVVAYHKVYGKP